MKIENRLQIQDKIPPVKIFDALYDLYSAVKRDAATQAFVDEYIYVVLLASEGLRKLPEEKKAEFMNDIRIATEIANESSGAPVNLTKILCTVKTPTQYAA